MRVGAIAIVIVLMFVRMVAMSMSRIMNVRMFVAV